MEDRRKETLLQHRYRTIVDAVREGICLLDAGGSIEFVNRCMAEIQRLTTNQLDVMLVSLTVDPRDDTVEALATYGERFGADTNRWLFLTGDRAELYRLIAASFLNQDLNDPFNAMPGNFSHTDRIALVDAQGRLRGFFDGLNPNTAPAVVAEISRLRQ